jgi:hypothetical protein
MPVNVIDRLQKLIAHEKSVRQIGSIAEAEAFTARVQEMLTRHKLTMSDVEVRRRNAAEDIDMLGVHPHSAGLPLTSYRMSWQLSLGYAIARVNQCALLTIGSSTILYFAGRKSDRKAAARLFLYLLELAVETGNATAKLHLVEQRRLCEEKHGPSARRKMGQWMRNYRASFHRGFGEAIANRFLLQYEKMLKAERDSNSAHSPGLVLIREDALAVRRFVDERLKLSRPASEKEQNNIRDNAGAFNGTGYAHGYRAGDCVALTDKVLVAYRRNLEPCDGQEG